MNHVLENAIIVAVLLAVILIPVSLVIINSRRAKKKKISEELIKAEKDLKLNFHHIDHLDSSIIAMDQDKKVIIQMDLENYSTCLIDLKNIVSCDIEEKKDKKAMLLLYLVLRYSDQKVPRSIVLYRQYIDKELHLKKLYKIATQWEVMINRAISAPMQLA
ncbi:MAG: hypothetical protein JST50_22740 [Bacteroidetes bacterium]|jgi:hypothetical protein|nr:hypothetical protein [Bacteroidota bacterium]